MLIALRTNGYAVTTGLALGKGLFGHSSWIRIGGYGLKLVGPRYPVFFSERYGHHKTLFRIAGWRLLRFDASTNSTTTPK